MKTIAVLSLSILLFTVIGCENSKQQANSNGIIMDTIRYANSSQVKEIFGMRNGEKNGIWKIFTPKGKLNSVVYTDKNKIIAILDTADFNLSQYSNDSVKLSLPHNWLVKKDYPGCILFAVNQIGCDTLIPPSVGLLYDTMSNASLDEYVIKTLCEYPTEDSMIIVSKKWLMIDNLQAYQFQYFATKEKKRCYVHSTIIQYGSIFFLITAIVDRKKWQYIKYVDLFSEIANSFRLI